MPARNPQNEEAIDRWMKSLLASTSETAVVVLSREGEILAWLGASSLLFGYEASEAVGRPLSMLFTDEDVAAQLDKQERDLTLSNGRSEDDRWHVRKDGSRFWGSGVMEPIRDEHDNVMALAKVLRDRTDVRTHVVSLHNRLAASEEQNANRLRMLATIAHELRNQVAPLSNLLAALEKTAAQPALTGGMKRQMQVMGRLLDDLAREATASAGGATLKAETIELQPVLEHAAEAMRPLVLQRRQNLGVTLPAAPITLEADAQRVNQMMVNLLGNASKYSPSDAHIQLSATIEDDMVAIRVEDDGNGIPADLLPKVFELFTREPRSDAPDGLGVGLAVVKNLAELHGGFVEGRSPGPGKGSVFTIRLPLVQARRRLRFDRGGAPSDPSA